MSKLKLIIKNIEETVEVDDVKDSKTLTISIDSSDNQDLMTRLQANEKLVGKLGFNVDYTVRETELYFDKEANTMKRRIKSENSSTGPLTFAFSPKLIKFKKQMYAPNEIVVDLLVTAYPPKNSPDGAELFATISKEKVEEAFSNRQVQLWCDDKEVCTDYYIHEIQPRYKQESMYVTLKIFSPDKLMTLSEYSRTYVAKKLMSETLETQRKNFELPYSKKKENEADKTKKVIEVDYSNLQNIKVGNQEHIFPYLVQYNESFYDFMARTTNRWGEFLCWEDGKLSVGYKDSDEKMTAKYDTITYCDLTSKRPKQEGAGDYTAEAPYDKNIWNSPFKKDTADKVVNELGCAWGDGGGDVYLMKKIQGLLSNDKNLWDFTFNTLVADGVALGQAQIRVQTNNEKFNKKYFKDSAVEAGKKKDVKDIPNAVEQWNNDSYNEFSEFTPVIDETTYGRILAGEMAAGKNGITIEFGTTFPGYKLGQVFKLNKKKYIVVEIEGGMPEVLKIVDNSILKKEVDTTTMVYKVVAVAQNGDGKFYPPMISSGHIRHSGSQIAIVEDADDPMKKNRVRVKYTWQDKSEDSSPWIVFGTNAASEKAGIQSKHYKNDRVWVDFVYGNIERPYVVASIPDAPPGPLKLNNIVHSTPSGEVIKMTDGVGLGASAMIDGLLPATKMLQGFFPGVDLFGVSTGGNDDKDSPMKSKFFEGGIELCDKYGIWSIKGSTDGRNVTVKSAWGDVKINAFTGITISAPNGDIKIAGKNVTIEAGNNLTLTSGKNVKNKFLWSVVDAERGSWANLGLSVAQALPKAAASYVANQLDISTFRHLIELFIKPVEGKLQLTSNRYLMLEAGGGKTAYPVDAYNMNKKVKVDNVNMNEPEVVMQAFGDIMLVVNRMYQEYKQMYTKAKALKNELVQAVESHKKGENLPCKKIDDMLSAMWSNNNLIVDDAFMEFKDYLQKVEIDNITDEMINYWFPANMNMENKKAKKTIVAGLMGACRGNLVRKAQALAEAINEINTYSLEEHIADYTASEKLRDWLKDALLNPQGIIKKQKDEAFKKLTATLVVTEPEMRKQCRKFFIELVKKFEFKRSAYLAPGAAGKPTTPAEPNPFDDNIEEKWLLYVNSIRMMPKKNDKKSTGKKLGDSIVDPLVQVWKKNLKGLYETTVTDHLAYASAKRGKILFSASPGTMVLDEDIYRANVDFAEDINYGVKNGVEQKVDGYATKVRQYMMV